MAETDCFKHLFRIQALWNPNPNVKPLIRDILNDRKLRTMRLPGKPMLPGFLIPTLEIPVFIPRELVTICFIANGLYLKDEIFIIVFPFYQNYCAGELIQASNS